MTYTDDPLAYDQTLEERQVIAQERQSVALEHVAAALIRIADQMPALIEKMGQRSSWSGGGKKDGRDLGTFKLPPQQSDIDKLKQGDLLRVMVCRYQVTKNDYGEFINYFAPFDKDGNLVAPPTAGMKACSIKTTSKKFPDVVSNFDKYTKDGKPHPILLKRAGLCVGKMPDKDNKFLFLVSLKDNEEIDPSKIDYNGIIPAQE